MPNGRPLKSSTRTELLRTLSQAARKLSTQTVFLHQALAQTVGLNATDTRCLDLLVSYADETLTAGRLSSLTGLSTGAITHILDRLEKRGLVERVRDSRDRRKIFVRLRSESIKPFLPEYELIGKAYLSLIKRFNDEELGVILNYMQGMSEMTERLLAEATMVRADES
jgi:DNA-binding MarR family transcriptional regulator